MNIEEIKLKYPYVYAWAQVVHPNQEYFLKLYLQEAIDFNAKSDSVFRISGDKWISYSDITNIYTRKKLDQEIKKQSL